MLGSDKPDIMGMHLARTQSIWSKTIRSSPRDMMLDLQIHTMVATMGSLRPTVCERKLVSRRTLTRSASPYDPTNPQLRTQRLTCKVAQGSHWRQRREMCSSED